MLALQKRFYWNLADLVEARFCISFQSVECCLRYCTLKFRSRTLTLESNLLPSLISTSSYFCTCNCRQSVGMQIKKEMSRTEPVTIYNATLCLRECIPKRTVMHHFKGFINRPVLTQFQLECYYLGLSSMSFI